MNKKHIELVL